MRHFSRAGFGDEYEFFLLPYVPPLCANCGLEFERMPQRPVSRAGAPLRWCSACQHLESKFRSARRRLVRAGLGFYQDNLIEVSPTLPQRGSGQIFVNGRTVFGHHVMKHCANPECKTPSYCVRIDGVSGHKEDQSCHFPAWIDGVNRKYCGEACRKRHQRSS
jgi:hypothetical protein